MSGTNSLSAGGGGNALTNGPMFHGLGGGSSVTTNNEATAEFTMQGSATFSNMGINSQGSIATGVFRTRKNAGNGNQVVNPPISNDSWITDSTHSDAVVAGNGANYAFGSNSFDMGIRGITMQHNSTVPNVYYGVGCTFAGGAGTPFAVAVSFCQMLGVAAGNTVTEGNKTLTNMQAPGTLSSLGACIGTASTGTITINPRIAGVNGNQVLSIASGTGFFQDTTHTDAIATNTDCDNAYSSTNASGKFTLIMYLFAGTTSAHDFGCSNDVGVNLNATATMVSGQLYSLGLTEVESQTGVPYGCTTSRLRLRSFSSTSGTEIFRNNATNGNQTVTFSATTGLVIDLTHTDSLAATALINTTGAINSVSSLFITMDDLSFTGSHPNSFGSVV